MAVMAITRDDDLFAVRATRHATRNDQHHTMSQSHQQLKEELGLDHFEGRSWPGFHHHAALCFLAYGFLASERARGTATALDAADETDRPFANRHPVLSHATFTAD
jgi:hypothetical protein